MRFEVFEEEDLGQPETKRILLKGLGAMALLRPIALGEHKGLPSHLWRPAIAPRQHIVRRRETKKVYHDS
jgi:hypothetical protein